MDTLRTNRPTLDTLRQMPVADLVALPGQHLALLQADAREVVEDAKRLQECVEAAIALRYEQRAVGARAAAGKDTGIIHFQDGTVEVTVDLPKRVEWDQRRLAALAEQIRAGGENPTDYLDVSLKVSERAYVAWPERIRKAFEAARTVRSGRPTYRLEILPDDVAARRAG